MVGFKEQGETSTETFAQMIIAQARLWQECMYYHSFHYSKAKLGYISCSLKSLSFLLIFPKSNKSDPGQGGQETIPVNLETRTMF